MDYKQLFHIKFLQKIFFLIILYCPTLSYASFVPESKAKKIAISILQKSRGTRSFEISLDMVYNGLEEESRSSDYPPFYVFNNSKGKGFVIISGEDAVMPVLGYSINNNFVGNSMPTSVKGWLVNLKEQISYIRNRKIEPASNVITAWKSIVSQGPSAPILQLETAQWDQGTPYNGDCFMINGRHALTGCVAAATAIVMRYHQWPDIGVGTLPSYTFDSYIVPAREFKPYDWDNMPLEDTDLLTSVQKKAIAQLMSDCGVMLKSIYGLNATEAYTADVPMNIGKFMKYDKGARFLLRDDFSDVEWNRMLQSNLHECGPIIYKGAGSAGGHSFVLDGYSSDGYYSVNWGWGGTYNGLFLLDVMRPGMNIDLSYEQGAVLGIRKDIGGKFKEEISFKKANSDDFTGLKASTDVFVKNSPFDLTVNGVTNTGSVLFESVDFLLALTDKNGNIKLELGQWNVRNLRSQYITDEYKGTFTITCDIFSEDRIRLFYRSFNRDWTLVKSVEYEDNSWEIIVKDNEENSKPIGECVSLQYDKLTRYLQLNVQKGIDVTMFNLKGENFSSALTQHENVYNIDTNQFELDTYLLHFVRDNESMEIQIVVGQKNVSF